jgi:putative ABC transport system substrate-binding protein
VTPSRRAFLAIVAATPFAAHAQQPQRPLHVGILSSGTSETRGHLEQALLQGLRDQGYQEGRNLRIERRYSGAGGHQRVVESASELAGMKLDAVVTTCTSSTGAAKDNIAGTPIIMSAVADPVGQGLVASLAKPGRNITGLSSQGEELLPKMMEFFSRVLPKPATVAVLANGNNPVHATMWRRLTDSKAVQALNLKLIKVEFKGSASLAEAFASAVRNQASALFVLSDDPVTLNVRAAIVRLAAQHKLPDFYWAREFVDAGGLMSYGESLRTSYRTAATYLVKVAKGAKPADLPVQQPTRFELVLNRKRAQALGISIPQDLAVLADEILE